VVFWIFRRGTHSDSAVGEKLAVVDLSVSSEID
jgi:hypothetical protein